MEKSSAQTFAVFAVYTLFCVLEGLYRSLFPRATSQADMLACPFGDCRESQKPCRLLRGFLLHGEAMEGKNPLVSLTVMALIYTVLLFRNKRKYGD